MEIRSLFKLKSRFVTREVGDELILVPLSGNVAEMNALFTLNETAKFIWDNAAENNSIDDLLKLMLDTFDIDEQTARKDIESFLEKLETTLV